MEIWEDVWLCLPIWVNWWTTMCNNCIYVQLSISNIHIYMHMCLIYADHSSAGRRWSLHTDRENYGAVGPCRWFCCVVGKLHLGYVHIILHSLYLITSDCEIVLVCNLNYDFELGTATNCIKDMQMKEC